MYFIRTSPVASKSLVATTNAAITGTTTSGSTSGTYTANWTATNVLAINTNNLPIAYNDTSSRTWMAIGVSGWHVDYLSGSTKIASEDWSAPDPVCYKSMSTCVPGGANAGSYLYGIVSEYNMTQYLNMTIQSISPTDSRLYDTSSVNPRFQGPGAVGQTNSSSNIEGFYTSGAYGWAAGAVTGNASRDYRTAVGVMIPLKWTVSGTLY